MKTYLVGGAIRDNLLGLKPKERDWVVVGSSPDEMKSRGFKQVGKDFPVFIDPESGEEYALARTERKSGHGYTGFNFDYNSTVTLEEDLKRRDLTINAIAQDENGILIDPFNGQKDIELKKLRHVSDAFSEDPLRVLRIIRFKVNLNDFEIAPETIEKIKEIIKSGELEYLTGERIWLELYKTENLSKFFLYSIELNINFLFPGLNAKTLSSTQCDNLSLLDKFQSMSYVISKFGKNIENFCNKIKVPNDYKDLAIMFHDNLVMLTTLNLFKVGSEEVLHMIRKLDIRKKSRLQNFFSVFRNLYPHQRETLEFFISLVDKVESYKLDSVHKSKSGAEIREIIDTAHINIIDSHLEKYKG